MHTPSDIPADSTADSGEFPKGYVERATQLIQGNAAAAADPLPGPLLDAYLPEPFQAAGLELRPVVPSDIAMLKRLKSPLIELMKQSAAAHALPDSGAAPEPKVEFGDEEVWELVYLWTHAPRENRALLAKGAPAFREAAMAMADGLPMAVATQGREIMNAIVGNYLRAFSTRLAHAPAASGEGNFPKPPAHGATASAGGSIT